MNKKSSGANFAGQGRRALGILILVLVVALPASFARGSGEQRVSQSGNIRIKNFGKVDEHLYRGAQPSQQDIRDLARLGVKTVIDLRDDPERFEASTVKSAGMRYINIPMSDKRWPSDGQTAQFLKLISQSETGPFYIHCAGGRHRTGVMVAVYRMTHYNWSSDQAYAEMKDYDFYTRWGHGALKDYVFSYYRGMHRSESPAKDPAAAKSAALAN
jgi:protein tyrosine/serine phosphatase